MSLLEVLLPERCAACDAVLSGPGVFCVPCEATLTPLTEPWCERCAEPGVAAGSLCRRCTREAPNFGRARSAFMHEAALAKAIHRFKYQDRPDLSRQLGALFAGATRQWVSAKSVVVPVPLHVSRFQQRKYDQAALLAVELSRAMQVPLHDGWVRRVRATERQVGKSEAERASNLNDAFEASPAARGANVVLVDDVYTTGATARSITRALETVGAKVTLVLTLSRMQRLDQEG